MVVFHLRKNFGNLGVKYLSGKKTFVIYFSDKVKRVCGHQRRGLGKQEWRSGESARLPPMWSEFDSGPGHVWVELVVGSRLAPKVFPGCSGFPPLTKTNISKFQFDQDKGPEKPPKADMALSLNIVIN